MMALLTDEEYVNSSQHCPVCASGDTEAGEHNADGNVATYHVSCIACGAYWEDVFRLVGYGDLHDADDQPIKREAETAP